jgi:hypothetical protein
MTTSRPRPEPASSGSRPRPSDERAQLAEAGRTTRRIAILALVLAIVGVGLAASRFLVAGGATCQEGAWDVRPATDDLPAGWTVSAGQFDINRQQVTLLGPLPEDETSAQAVVYTTITCFPQGAADAVARSEEASRDAAQLVVPRDDLSDGGFSATDESGATFTQFRADSIVVYLAASGDASPAEVDTIASAFDKALGGDGGAIAVGTPDPGIVAPSDGLESAGPSEEVPSLGAVAPELEARLPTAVADLTLTVDSALGTDVFGEDSSSRAIIAALRSEGKTPADVTLAQAYDETEGADLSILAVEVDGLAQDKTQAIMLDSWLAASGAGVTREPQTIAGREFIVVDYGDEGTKDYVLAEDGAVIIITTASPELADAAAAALP